jgi:hypothetical protein
MDALYAFYARHVMLTQDRRKLLNEATSFPFTKGKRQVQGELWLESIAA